MATRVEISWQKAAIRAHGSMFGCSNGGQILDEPVDPTEAASALTESERTEERYQIYASDHSPLSVSDDGDEDGDFNLKRVATKDLTPHERTLKKRQQRRNKKAREANGGGKAKN